MHGWKTNLYFAVDREKVIHYDLVTKRTSVIREYDVVNRLFCDRDIYGYADYGMILYVMTLNRIRNV